VRVAVCDATPQRKRYEWLTLVATHCWVDVADGLAVAPDVDFVVVIFRGFSVNWVVEVHAFGVLASPVAPNQVSAGAE